MNPTDVLGLNRFELAEAFDYTLVNDNSDKTDRLAPTFCTSTTRPAANLFNGRLIYETDTGGSFAYSVSGSKWLPTAGPVVNYVPTISGFTGSNLSGTYEIVGKRIYFEVSGTLTGGFSNTFQIGKPGNLPSAIYPTGLHLLGNILVRDASVGLYIVGILMHRPSSASAINFLEVFLPTNANNALTAPTSTSPFIWANGDSFAANGFYDLA